MYLKPKDMVVLQIPKTGSSSMTHVARCYYAEHHVWLSDGHLTLQRTIEGIRALRRYSEYEINEVVAVIRKPADRFVSGVNHMYAGKSAVNADEAMRRAFQQHDTREQLVFRPQHEFLHTYTRIPRYTLFTFENLPSAVKYVITPYFDPVTDMPHKNKRDKRWTQADLEQSEYWEPIMKRYDRDVTLYTQALLGTNCYHPTEEAS